MSENRLEEREIDLIEVFWSALEQWRGILVVALLCAMLLPLGMGIKNAAHSSNAPAGVVSQKDADIKHQSALSVLSLYMQYKTLEKNYEDSALNRLDFTSAASVVSTYELQAGAQGQSMATLASAYDGLRNNDDFTAAIAALYGKDFMARSVYDLCEFRTITSRADGVALPDQQGKTFLIVNTVLPAGVTAEAWSGTLTQALQKYSQELNATFGPQSVKLISMNATEAYQDKVSSIQSTKIAAISSARQKYEDTYKKLPSDGKSQVDGVISALEGEELAVYNMAAVQAELDKRSAAIQPKSGTAVGISSGFTPKWIGLGFGMGLVLYLGGLFVLAVLSRKVSYGAEIESSLGIRNFGSIHEYPYQGSWQRFLHDERIYERRHKSTGAEKIASDLATKLAFDETGKITMMVLGESSQRAREISRRQAEILGNSKISCEILEIKAPVSEMSDADFAGRKKVFLQILKGRTTYAMLSELCDKLSEYKVELAGMEFIDVA